MRPRDVGKSASSLLKFHKHIKSLRQTTHVILFASKHMTIIVPMKLIRYNLSGRRDVSPTSGKRDLANTAKSPCSRSSTRPCSFITSPPPVKLPTANTRQSSLSFASRCPSVATLMLITSDKNGATGLSGFPGRISTSFIRTSYSCGKHA
jgi:hypothetical protein